MAATEGTPLAASRRPPFFVYFATSCAALNSVNFGFDTGVSSGVAVLVREDMGLDEWEVGLFVGSLHIVSALGGLCNHAIADYFGRRMAFTVAQVFFLSGIATLCQAWSFGTLLLGRMLLGLGVGISFAIDPVYIAEIAPASHRGALTTWSEISINLGILLGFVANWLLAGLPAGFAWRAMVATGAVLPVVMTVLSMTVMPESPRWLVANGRVEEAQGILRRCHHPDEDVGAVISDIKKQIEADAAHAALGWRPLLQPDEVTRKMMMVGIVCAFVQQINGSTTIISYAPTIFEDSGAATSVKVLFALTVLVGLVKTLSIVVSINLLDATGRRPLLIVSTVIMSVSELLLAVGIITGWSWLAVSAVLLFVAAFSIGVGPVTWLLAAEVFPLYIRAKAMSLAAFTNRVTCGLVAVTFLPMCRVLGTGGYFFLFSFITAGTAAWAAIAVPETKCKTLEELTEVIQRHKYGAAP